MTLKEIGYLLTVAQCPSISEAAKQLYVAQPSLTHVIQSVEREVGFRIFERGRSGVTVTEQGEEFLSDIRSVYQQMEVIQSKYVEKRPERKNFSFSMQHFSLAGGAFLRFLQELREPCYTARCLEGGTADVIADVAAGRSEIGFLRFTDEEEPVVRKELRNEKLEFYSIQRTEPCVLLRRDHPLAERESLSRQDLEAYPLVSYDYGTDGAVSLAEEGVRPARWAWPSCRSFWRRTASSSVPWRACGRCGWAGSRRQTPCCSRLPGAICRCSARIERIFRHAYP